MDTPTSPKYIRTLEDDMEILKKGGTPDFVPVPLEKPTPLKTYAGDFLERMKETRASTVTVLAAEQDSAPRVLNLAPKKLSRTNLLYIIASVILSVAGMVGAYIAYTHYTTVFAPVASAPNASAPIFTDEQKQISGQGSALIQAIEQSVASPLASNSIRLLYIASATSSNVFSALPISAPDILLRNMNTNGNMAGVVSAGGNQSPFFILSVSSYGNTFAGMLSWEPAMQRALRALFPTYPAPSISATMATTTRSATTTSTASFTFHDEIVGNHDVRIYRDAADRSILLYGYWNQTILIIARDPSAFAEILERLATARAQ